jgi:mono/diheme cytochrome c family protein
MTRDARKDHPRRGGLIEAAVILALLVASVAGVASALSESKDMTDAEGYPPKQTLEASILRGDIAFQHYCSLCHGTQADGRGRAARLYAPKPANLRASRMTDSYKEAIIRRGGKAMGRSQFMPPWGEELTDEQVEDLVHFLRVVAPADAPK